MKSFFRFLYKNKLYTVIEVAGMSIAIAFVLFIGTFLIGEFTADSEIKKQGDIFVGASEHGYSCSSTIREQLEGTFPEITGMCRTRWTYSIKGISMEMTAGELDVPFAQDALITDKDFFRILPLPLKDGNADDVLEQTNSAVLSESFAAKAFPGRNPLGESVKVSIDGNDEFLTVTGIFKDFKNSILHNPDIIYRTDIVQKTYPSMLRNGNPSTTLFYKIAENADIVSLDEKIASVVKKNDMMFIMDVFKEYTLVPFDEINTSSQRMTLPFEGVIPLDFIRIFLAAGIMLLVFAILNYVSLTVAQTGFRAKEMASRRLVGAQRTGIVARYILESLILTCISFAMALIITGLTSPFFSTLIGKEINPLSNIGVGETSFMAGLILILALCSGMVPALVVSRYRPIDIVKGNLSGKKKMTLGKILITAQSVVVIAALAVSLTIFMQIRHMVNRPQGFETDNRIAVSFAKQLSEYRIDELKSIPGVEDIGWLMFSPVENSIVGMKQTINGSEVNLDLFYCDPKAFKILGFEVIKTCHGHVEGGAWVPESALAGLGIDYESMEIPFDNGPVPVCGIIRDFIKGSNNSGSINDYINLPVIKNMDSGDNLSIVGDLVVKVSSNENEAAKRISAFYESNDIRHIAVRTYNNQKQRLFYNEDRNLKLIGTFTILTLILTSLAMLAMSTYFAKQRSKETAVKKVMGCSRLKVFMETANGFLKLICIAAIISVPFSWKFAGRWLEGYSYRIDNGLWIYIAAAAAMAVIAVASISWQTIKLMNTDPAEALKNE